MAESRPAAPHAALQWPAIVHCSISGETVRGELIKSCLQVAHAGFYRSEEYEEAEPGGEQSPAQREEGGTPLVTR